MGVKKREDQKDETEGERRRVGGRKIINSRKKESQKVRKYERLNNCHGHILSKKKKKKKQYSKMTRWMHKNER